MSVSIILMAVIITATIPLGPTNVVVGLDIGWPLISGLVKVGMHAKMNVDLNKSSNCDYRNYQLILVVSLFL